MLKAVKVMLLLVALWVVTSSIQHAQASGTANIGLTNVNISSSTFVSKHPKPKPTLAPKKPIYTVELPKMSQVYAQNTETQTPTIPITSSPISTPTPTTTPPSANLDANKIFDMVNAYRVQNGLAPFEKANEEIQTLAQVRSTELIHEAQTGGIHSGLYNRNLPYWIWENAKYGSDEDGTVAWWQGSSLHRHSMLGNYKYTAVACTGNYCVQLFTSLIAK